MGNTIAAAHFRARMSAARTSGFLVRALRLTLRIETSENPACLNSLRKVPPSFAPAIHANQSVSLVRTSNGKGCDSISSAT